MNWSELEQSIDRPGQYKVQKCNRKCIIVIQELQMMGIKKKKHLIGLQLSLELNLKCIQNISNVFLYFPIIIYISFPSPKIIPNWY